MEKPLKNSIQVDKKINRLFFDCTWKGGYKYRCNVCDFISYEYKDNEECKRIIKEHIIENHSDFCYSCKNCKVYFLAAKEFKVHFCIN